MLLTIITPYYDTLEYTLKLANVLIPQLTDEVEWIIVDDGTNETKLDELEKVKVIHLPNNTGNASIPRNVGLDNAKGKYIAFIDSDDMVTDNYVNFILHQIKTSNFDYCFISWRCGDHEYIITDYPPEWNVCVWNCIYKREIIGDTRFDAHRNLGEDKEFNKKVQKGKKDNIVEILYDYKFGRPNSLTTRYKEGVIPFERDK